MRFWPGCCCDLTCLVLADDFDRTPSSTIDGWDERSGDWEIDSNQLHEAGTVGAMIIANASVPRPSFFVSVGIPAVVLNAAYRLYANYLDDTHYYMAEFAFDGTFLTISLYQTATLLKQETWPCEPIGYAASIYLYLAEGAFTACFSCVELMATDLCRCHLDPILYAGGRKAGLGNGSTEAIVYDDFLFEELDDTLDLGWCPICAMGCGCRCCGGDTLCDDSSADLCLSISSECDQLDGFECVLTRREEMDGNWYWDWYDEPPGTNFLSQIVLFCDPEGTRWEAYTLGATSTAATCFLELDTLYDGDCDPFSLTFVGHIEETEEGGCGPTCSLDDFVTITIECCPPTARKATSPSNRSATPVKRQETAPGLLAKLANYSRAVFDWLRAGKPCRSDAEVRAILVICEPCEDFDGRHCLGCGCCINQGKRALLNKARMKTAHCPLGKW